MCSLCLCVGKRESFAMPIYEARCCRCLSAQYFGSNLSLGRHVFEARPLLECACTFCTCALKCQTPITGSHLGPFLIWKKKTKNDPAWQRCSNQVSTEENPTTGPQTPWHWRTNYRIGPVTFSLRICQSRSRRQSKWKLPCVLTLRTNNSFQRRLSHHFKVFATDCAALDYYSTTPHHFFTPPLPTCQAGWKSLRGQSSADALSP